MAVNPMQRKSRNSFLLGMFLMLLIALIIVAIIYLLILLPKQKEKEKLAAQATTKQVYVVKMPIKSGDEISMANVESQKLDTGLNAADLVNVMTLEPGATAKIDLPIGTIVTSAMVNLPNEEVTDDVRLMEYNMITLPTTLIEGDYIDIRLTLPTGQDYIVVSKAKVMNVQNSTIGLHLSEEEILMMNSAIVEAYKMTASNFYAVQYVEAGNQNGARVTYTPTAEVQNLIAYDSNIVDEARKALEQRFSEGVRTYIDAATGLYSTQSLTNIEAGMQEQIEKAKEARKNYLQGISAETAQ